MTNRAPKGTVNFYEQLGWLHIRFRYQKKQYRFALGLPDGKQSRTQAEALCLVIQNDIAANVLDISLKKYKPISSEPTYIQGRLTAVALFTEFMHHKEKHVAKKTLEFYKAILRQLEIFFGAKPVEFIGMPGAEDFVDWLREQRHPSTKKLPGEAQIKRKVELLEAAWKWHMEPFNPWDKFKIKPEPKQPPKTFTLAEIEAILKAFRSSPYYCNYHDFVLTLFLSGARTGEIIGLKWKALNDDCSYIWITEIVTRGVTRPVKQHKARSFGLSPRLAELLRNVK